MPPRPETANARYVLKSAKQSVKDFTAAFTSVRKARKARGAPTSSDQDLVRAALVFAGAGLDSALKHLIRESLPALAENDSKVGKKFGDFVDKAVADHNSGHLGKALLSGEARNYFLDEYIGELTGSSLQSFDQLANTAAALGLTVEDLVKKKKELKSAFKDRNKIIHELDIRFEGKQGNRNRNQRTKTDLESQANLFLAVGDSFVKGVENSLKDAG